MFGVALQPDHVFEAGAFGDGDGGVGDVGVFVADVFDEEEDEDVVLILAGVHAAAEFVATGPKGAVESGFLERHCSVVPEVQAPGMIILSHSG